MSTANGAGPRLQQGCLISKPNILYRCGRRSKSAANREVSPAIPQPRLCSYKPGVPGSRDAICNSTAWVSHQIRQDIGIEQKSHRHKSTDSAGPSSIGGNSSSSVASVARMASSEFGGAGSMISHWPSLRMIQKYRCSRVTIRNRAHPKSKVPLGARTSPQSGSTIAPVLGRASNQ